MKQIIENTAVEKHGNKVVEHEFRIRHSAASFAILSSGLYSNKPLAIVRELSCNAFDAHKEAGKADVPFDLTLPTIMNPYFIIKDYGTGLSHEQVITTYTTYFESTKTDSDDYIGQLGLGSKSPFSYSTQFTVESRQDGRVNMYSMFINDIGMPSVAHLGVDDTEEPNGITITIPIKSGDFSKFENAAITALTYFDPYPNILGESFYTPFRVSYTLKRDDWGIRNNTITSDASVIQGFVKYPIDKAQLREYNVDDLCLSVEASAILDAPIDFFVPIGMVQVAPSREHLSYDKHTLKNLVVYINKAAEDMATNLQELIDGCESLWDARLTVASFMYDKSPFRKLYEKLVDKKFNLTYQGTPIKWGIDVTKIDFSGGVHIHEITAVMSGGGRRRYRRVLRTEARKFDKYIVSNLSRSSLIDRIYIKADVKTKVMYVDKPVSLLKVREYVTKNFEEGGSLIVIRPADKKVSIEDKLEHIYGVIGIPSDKVIRVSDLISAGKIELPSVAGKSSGGVRDKSQKPVWQGGARTGDYYHHSDWYRMEVDMEAGGIYAITSTSKWTTSDREDVQSSLGSVIDLLIEHGIIKRDEYVVSINKADEKLVINNPNWVDILDLYEQYIIDNMDNIAKSVVAEKESSLICSSRLLNAISKPIIPHLTAGSAASEFMKRIVEISNNKYNKFKYFAGIRFKDSSIRKKLEKKVNAMKLVNVNTFFDTYPVLKILSTAYTYSYDKEEIAAFADYLNMIDERNTNALMFDAVEVDLVEETV